MEIIIKIKGMPEQIGQVVEENEFAYFVKTENDNYAILKNHKGIEYEIVKKENKFSQLTQLVKEINKCNHPATLNKLWYFTELVEKGMLDATMETYKKHTAKQMKEMLKGQN